MSNLDRKQLKIVEVSMFLRNCIEIIYCLSMIFCCYKNTGCRILRSMIFLFYTHLTLCMGSVNDGVLSGRTYEGCAIFWRSTPALTPVTLDTGSRRVCTVLFKGKDVQMLYVCVYLPYEKAKKILRNSCFRYLLLTV